MSEMERILSETQEEKGKESGEMGKKLSLIEKEKADLVHELSVTKQQLKHIQGNLTELSKSFEDYQEKNNNHTNYLSPILERLKIISAESKNYSKFMEQYENNKSKLLKVSNYKIEHYEEKFLGDAIR